MSPLYRMGCRSHRRIGWFGFLLAGFALVSQIALGAVVSSGETARSQIAALDAVSVFCHGTYPAGSAPHQRPQRPANPALCPLGIALTLPSAVLTGAPALPPAPRAILLVGPRENPAGRGSPPASAHVGLPRAPPGLAS